MDDSWNGLDMSHMSIFRSAVRLRLAALILWALADAFSDRTLGQQDCSWTVLEKLKPSTKQFQNLQRHSQVCV